MTSSSTGVAYVPVVELLTLAAGTGARPRAGRARCRPETVPLADAAGRVLAEAGAGAGRPPAVPELGDGRLRPALGGHAGDGCRSSSGSPPGSPAPRPLAPGEAMGIATGGVVPDGADAVIQHELVVEEDNTFEIPSAVAAGANVRPVGRDVVAGGIVARRGPAARPGADRRARRSRGRRGGLRAPAARRRPDDRDGAARPGLAARPGRGLRGERRDDRRAARGRRRGGDAARVGRRRRGRAPAVRSSRASSTTCSSPRAASRSARTTSSGGSRPSSGSRRSSGASPCGPGKPVSFGVRGQTLVFGLPGNPVSTLVGCELFVRPAILALQGADRPRPALRRRARSPSPSSETPAATISSAPARP